MTTAMARVKMEASSGIAGLSGRVGNLVFRQGGDGQTYVQQAPTGKSRPSSALQQVGRSLFAVASEYGKQQQASAEGRAYYQPLVVAARFSNVYREALTDYLNPPRILNVEADRYQGQAGGQLRVQVEKKGGTATVVMQLLDAAGRVLEEGEATLAEAGWWAYTTQQNQVATVDWQLRVQAWGRPGNVADMVVDLK